LHLVQVGEITPIGSDRAQSCNVRLLTASSRPLAALVEAGQFRQDLYFRLRGFALHLPPLRERPEDIPALAEFFTAKHSAAMGRKILGISAAALQKLAAYDFPGNVRELENEIRRMVALAKDGAYLTTSMMSPPLLAAAGRKSFRIEAGFAPEGDTLKAKIESLEKHLVREALARHKWNRSRVAEELGLSRVGLANKIKRYGLNEAHGSAV
jgi:two-component system, NtrC family, response regulator HupR/HoxA